MEKKTTRFKRGRVQSGDREHRAEEVLLRWNTITQPQAKSTRRRDVATHPTMNGRKLSTRSIYGENDESARIHHDDDDATTKRHDRVSWHIIEPWHIVLGDTHARTDRTTEATDALRIIKEELYVIRYTYFEWKRGRKE